MSKELMKKQWDEMAQCNAFFGITSWPEFEHLDGIDQKRFWETGRIHVRNLLGRMDLGDTRQLTMLEIGCGMGRMTHCFAERFARVVALDISPEMIARAKNFWSHLSNVSFLEGNGADLSQIDDASIDFVFSFYVFAHITDPDVVLEYVRETARVLRRGGRALLHLRLQAGSELETPPFSQRLRARWRDRGPGFWWNRGIVRNGVAYTTDLPERFGRFESWGGCLVAWPDVQRICQEAGLIVTNTDLAKVPDSRFLFLYLKKRSG